MTTTADLTQNLSHPVKTDTITILYTRRPQAEVHKAGCAHEARAKEVGTTQSRGDLLADLAIYRDDYYYVAPCARKA